MTSIRPESPEDRDAVRDVLVTAFGDTQVADGVDRIRDSWIYRPTTSLVAEADGIVVGFVMITGCTIVNDAGERVAAMLTPLGVRPEHQGRGIGSSLVRAAVTRAEGAGEPLVLLEGSPVYYGRLGFEDARRHGIDVPVVDGAPPEAGQVRLLRSYDAAEPSLRGRLTYPPVY